VDDTLSNDEYVLEKIMKDQDLSNIFLLEDLWLGSYLFEEY
jgi:hypothetical protein